jgi:Castor and Pollux, part of voltage-gated ion channel
VVVTAQLTGALLAHSAAAHGLSQVVTELLTFPSGNEFYWIPVGPDMAGRSFGDMLVELKRDHDCIPLAVAGADGYAANPPLDRVLVDGERVLVIAREAPHVGGRLIRRPGSTPVH